MIQLPDVLLSAQTSTNITPYCGIYFGTSYGFTTLDSFNRIISWVMTEEPFGSTLQIQLSNADGYFNNRMLQGMKVTLNYGASSAYVTAPPFWVFSQRDVSVQGNILTEFTCGDVLNLMSRDEMATGGTRLVGRVTIGESKNFITSILTGPTGSGCIADYSNNYIDLVQVQGSFAPGQQASCGGMVIDIESVSSISSGGVIPTWGNLTVLQILQLLFASQSMSVYLDQDDPQGHVANFVPKYQVSIGASVRDALSEIMSFTRCGIRIRQDGAHIVYVDPNKAPNYSYDGFHVQIGNSRDKAVVLPNRVIVCNHNTGTTDKAAWVGSAVDQDSINMLGRALTRIFEVSTATSDADATTLAENILYRTKADLNIANIVVPIMNFGHELFDNVSISDSRSGATYYGHIGKLIRGYEQGKYSMTIYLGGVSSASEVNYEGNIDTVPIAPAVSVPLETKVTPWTFTDLPAAIQGYRHDITFHAVSWNTVSWDAGVIKFYDGTEQSIAAGQYTMPTGNVYYAYFDLDNNPTQLKFTTNYINVMTMRNGVVCLVKRGSSQSVACTIIPSYGKEPLITADIIYLTGFYDLLPDGQTYGKIYNTCIDSHHIALNEYTVLGSGNTFVNNLVDKINASATTLIEPGKVTISGNTTLEDWKDLGDETKIRGSAIQTRSIELNKLISRDTENLLDNPDFEKGDLTGWIISSGNYVHISSYEDGLPKYTIQGNYSLHLHIAYHYQYAAQIVRATYEDVFTLEATVDEWESNMPSAPLWLIIAFLDSNMNVLGEHYISESPKWYTVNRRIRISAKAPANTYYCRAQIHAYQGGSGASGFWVVDDCRLYRSSKIIVMGTPDSNRIEITPDKVAGYGVVQGRLVERFSISSSDGAARCGGGKVILDEQGVRLYVPSHTYEEQVWNNYGIASGSELTDMFYDIVPGRIYCITARASANTVTDGGWSLKLDAYNSSNQLVARSRVPVCEGDDTVLTSVVFYSGDKLGLYNCRYEVSVKNVTGSTRWYDLYITISELL